MARQTPAERTERAIARLLAEPRPRLTAVEREARPKGNHARVAGELSALRDLPRERFKERVRKSLERRATMGSSTQPVKYMREGFRSVTPYLILPRASEWIDQMKRAFGAAERFRANRPGSENVIMHAEIKIGDSILEVADSNEQFPFSPVTLLLRVEDPDAAYQRALDAGATPVQPVADYDYGSRGGTVRDLDGNSWHVFRPTPGNKIFENFHSVTPHFNPVHSAEFIDFLERAFGGEETYRAQTPDGVIHHAQVRIGDSIVPMGDAHGPYQPAPATLHLYVPDTDAAYERALGAGATSIQPPADQPYGERNAGVRDPLGNRWFIATHLRDVAP